MAARFTPKRSNALKHGGYSTIGLLPGESPAEFEKHQNDVIGELAPNGPVEHDIVSTIAGLLWRKQNLSTFRTAELARQRRDQIIDEELTRREIPRSIYRVSSYEGEDEQRPAREDAVRREKREPATSSESNMN
jgi:hypothetical protein